MLYYVDIWAILTCVTACSIFFVTHKKAYIILCDLASVTFFAIWVTQTPHYYTMEAIATYIAILFVINVIAFTKWKLSRMDIFVITFMCVFFWFGFVMSSAEDFHQWYINNVCEVEKEDPSRVYTYVIPTETERVRFVGGFEFYQVEIGKNRIDGDYNIKFFAYVDDEAYGQGMFYELHECTAEEVEVQDKNPSDLDYVNYYIYKVKYIDPYTGECLKQWTHYKFEFFLPANIAQKIRDKLKL